MIRDEIEQLLLQHPFEPLLVQVTRGERYKIRNSALVALLKSAVFIASPNSDNRVIIPFLHIAAVEVLNGRRRRSTSRRKKP